MSFILKIKQKIIKWYFQQRCADIENTPPLNNISESAKTVLLSMVQTSDVHMLMLAVKSFVRFVPVKKIVIVADPSLTQRDREILRQHFVKVEFLDAINLRTPEFPKGGCWERILGISTLSAEDYVVQLDADTITMKKPEQVLSLLNKDVSFTLGTWDGLQIVDVAAAASFARERLNPTGSHIQLECEALLEQLPEGFNNYVRGCAGFAGYRLGSVVKEKLQTVSGFYYQALGKRWEEWGSEQFASNVLVANDPGSRVLDIHQYDVPDKNQTDLAFHHYIGTMRFANLIYTNNALKTIKELKTG